MTDDLLAWLLDSDPALRWQVERDLAHEPPEVWEATRARVATVLHGTADLLAENCRWEYDNLPFWDGEVDCCINAWTVANGVWLGGGWNCEWVNGSTRSSFHSTLNSLKGLVTVEGTADLRRAGEEYLLERGLFRRAGAATDPRITDAIERIRAARQPDGTWLQGGRAPGRVWFEVDVPAGEPSKWLTLYGTRVLDWWDGA